MAGSLIGALRVALGLDSAQFESGVKRARGEAQKASRGISQDFGTVASSARGVATGIAGMVTSIAAAAVPLVRINAEVQSLQAQLRVATGSIGAAAEKFQQLEQFAAETPFSLNEVVEAFTRMKNLGLDPTIGALNDYGNLAASMGMPLMQFIEAVADASVSEFERLKEFGIKAQKDGEKIRFTFRGITTEVQNNADSIVEYLRRISQENFGDGMALQAQTINGALSNLGDTFNRLISLIGQMGFNDFFIRQVRELTRFMDAFARVAKNDGLIKAMTSDGNRLAEAGSPKGYLARLEREENDAFIQLQNARRRQEGMFPMAPQVVKNLETAFKAASRARAKFEAENAKALDPLSAMFPLNDNGGFGAIARPTPAPAPGKKTKAKKPTDFTLASMEEGWALRQLTDAGTPATIELNNQALEGVGDTLRDLAAQDFSLEIIRPAAFEQAERFAENLSASLGQALVFGQSIGDALVNSFKAAAAEMITSGLMDILLGSRGASGRRSGGIIGSLFGIPGFANGTNYAPGGLAMVGERGRELMQLPRGSRVIPNGQTEAMMGGRQMHVTVGVDPRNGNLTAFVNSQIAATAPAIAQAGASIAQGQLSQRAQRRFR